jgi:phage baseplate assembly protein gpV
MADVIKTMKAAGKQAEGKDRKQTFTGIVCDNADPEKMQKVRVTCEQLYGTNPSPWCICDTLVGGDGFGWVVTPKIGDKVNLILQQGDVSVPRYQSSTRVVGNAPPVEFEPADVNGLKTPSGVLILWDDIDGSVKLQGGSGSFVYINGAGEIWIKGNIVYTDGETHLNKGLVPIALGGPLIKCPITGMDIPSSGSCYVSEA